MLVTPLKVFASIYHVPSSTFNKHTHRLLIEEKEYNHSSIKIIFQFSPQIKEGQKKVYVDQIERLVDKVFLGYDSAGIFISAEENNMNEQYLDLTESLLNTINKSWEIKNQQRKRDSLPPIKMEGGVFEFIDEYCIDYINGRQMKSDYMTGNDLLPYLHPMSNTNELYRCIQSIPRTSPTILYLYFTDNKTFYSRLAWVSFPSPFSKTSSYNQTFSSLNYIIQAYLKKDYEGIINTHTYIMQRMILNCFLGHYNTMIFSHYSVDSIMQSLQFTSEFKKIICKVNPDQPPKMNTYSAIYDAYGNHEKEDLNEKQSQLEFYKKNFLTSTKDIEEQEKIDRSLTMDIEILKYKNDVNRQRIAGEKAMEKWELAKFKNEIREYKIALIQATTARESYSFTQQDLELLLDMDNETIESLQQDNEYSKVLAAKLENELTTIITKLTDVRSMNEEETRNYEYSMNQLQQKYSVKENGYISKLSTFQQEIKALEDEAHQLRQKNRLLAMGMFKVSLDSIL
ncbi:hypothetical protein BJ944DRAFT_239837 [Cunninghamella echinulata]|nr:hypothetical protein BJ944DRAFT_239837 [Cunninghamella echinulata]